MNSGKKPVILKRAACLGDFTLNNLHLDDYTIVTFQKHRIDYILNSFENPGLLAKAREVIPHYKYDSAHSVAKQQEKNLFFSYENVSFIIMDSLAEMADQLFVSKDGWQFLAGYSDMNHTEEFKQNFTCFGRLNPDELESWYRKFFTQTNKVYGNVPIIFLHFSAKFHRCEELKAREAKIIEIIEKLELEFKNLHSLKLENEDIIHSGEENVPLHFNAKTYVLFAEKVLSLGVLPKKIAFIYKINKYFRIYNLIKKVKNSYFYRVFSRLIGVIIRK